MIGTQNDGREVALGLVTLGIIIPAPKAVAFGESRRFQEPSVGALCLAPDGRTLVTGGRGGVVRIRSLQAEVKITAARDLTRIAFSADGRWATAGGLGAVHEVRTGRSVFSHLLAAPGDAYNSARARVRFSHDSRLLSNGEQVFDVGLGGLVDAPLVLQL